jgi:6-phosphogluconolactonase (cycloisomerase 2 family)
MLLSLAIATPAFAARGLAFVEFVLDGEGAAFSASRDLAISPDDQFLYVASRAEGIGVLSLDSAGGRVANVQAVIETDHVGLEECHSVALSPDGAHLYATGNAGDGILMFERDAGTGILTHVQTLLDGQCGVDGLDGANQVRVSPDGLHVYAVSDVDDAVAVFSRDAVTGELTFVEAHFDGVSGVDGLDGAFSVAIAPDGKSVYVTGRDENALAAFSRDAVTGELMFVEAEFDGVGGVDGLDSLWRVAVSPDGAHVYTASNDDDAVAVFARDTGTGALTFVESVFTQSATSLAFSSDELTLWVGHGSPDGATSYDRDPTTGELTFVERVNNGSRGMIGCGDVEAVATTSDDSFLYLACSLNHAITTLQVLDVACPSAPIGGCRQTTVGGASALTMKSGLPGTSQGTQKDLLSWRWKRGAATSLAEFGDPLSETDYALCVYDASADPQPFARGNVPADNTCKGVPCWQLKNGLFKYKDREKVIAINGKTTAPDGLLKVLLKPGEEGKTVIKTKQKGEGVAGYTGGLQSLARTTPVIVQLISSTGECWEAVYSTPKLNTPGLFKAKSD